MTRSPFPLSWPESVPRARYRDTSQFDKSRGFNAARDGALHELGLFRASHVVITSNVPVNAKGLPTLSSIGYMPDPGIAVWWVKKGVEHVLACDRWQSATENMRAIEKTLEAIRGIARWGTAEMVDRAFAGFAALPPGSGDGVVGHAPAPKTWRELFGVNIAPWNDLPKPDLLAIVKARHREQIKECHPDRASNDAERASMLEQTMRLNAALTVAELELK